MFRLMALWSAFVTFCFAEVLRQRLSVDAMKLKIRVSAAISVGVGILFILAGTGCSSAGGRAMVNHDAQCLTHSQCLGFAHGTAVSPLGDAPFERDLELTRGLSTSGRAPCVACVAELGQASLAR